MIETLPQRRFRLQREMIDLKDKMYDVQDGIERAANNRTTGFITILIGIPLLWLHGIGLFFICVGILAAFWSQASIESQRMELRGVNLRINEIELQINLMDYTITA